MNGGVMSWGLDGVGWGWVGVRPEVILERVGGNFVGDGIRG